MSDKIAVGNLEKLQDQKCEFEDIYVWKTERLRGLILTGKQGRLPTRSFYFNQVHHVCITGHLEALRNESVRERATEALIGGGLTLLKRKRSLPQHDSSHVSYQSFSITVAEMEGLCIETI